MAKGQVPPNSAAGAWILLGKAASVLFPLAIGSWGRSFHPNCLPLEEEAVPKVLSQRAAPVSPVRTWGKSGCDFDPSFSALRLNK